MAAVMAQDGFRWAIRIRQTYPPMLDGSSDHGEQHVWQDEASLLCWRALSLLDQIGMGPYGTIFVFEPRTVRLADELRAQGFLGTYAAVLAHHLPPYITENAGWDHTIIEPWADEVIADDEQAPGEDSGRPTTPSSRQQCNILIASNLLRLVSRQHVPALLQWLAAHISPRGYLLWSEPESLAHVQQVEAQLSEAGLVTAVDPVAVEDGWPRVLTVFQVRGRSESRQIGVLRRVTRSQLEASTSLRQNLCAAYREGFGGEEWHEWARCGDPGCDRRYSRSETEALGPGGRCDCGWPQPVQPFHSNRQIIEKAYTELAEDGNSCCYVREAAGTIGGFAWGYHTAVDTLALALTSHSGDTAWEIRVRLQDWLASNGLAHCRDHLYYHSEEAVLEGIRSLSLTRALFHRSLQLAADRGAHVVVLRTSMHSGAYALLAGVGMKVIYRYHSSDGTLPVALNAPPGNEHESRVVLGGNLRQILGLLSQESDRQIAARIAHHLKRERSGGRA